MKDFKILTLLFFAFSLACDGAATSSQRAKSEDTSSTNYKSVANSSSSRVSTVPNSDEQLAGSGRGGGGGGSSRPQILAQKIALDQVTGTQDQTTISSRKIVRSADLTLEAESPQTSIQKITSIAEGSGGFVVESQESSSDVKTTEHDVVAATVRVPADKFNDVLKAVRETASRVIVENVKGEDVTEEFIDIEARLKAEKALETQFLEIMKRANSVTDALEVQRELADVRGEIEKIEGRKRFLENQSSLSTIKIKLQTPTLFATNSTGFFYRLTQSFSTGFDFALNFLLGLVTFLVGVLPLALVLGVPGFFIVRYFWRKQTSPRSFSEIAKEELENE